MKKLTEYINNDILESLNLLWKLKHISIFTESISLYFESTGLPKDFDKIADIMLDKIKNTDSDVINIDASEFEECSNAFFNNCLIKIIIDKYEQYCVYLSSVKDYKNNDNILKWNDIDKKFNYIEIEIHIDDRNNIIDEYELLLHELKHGWDDYQDHLHGKKKVMRDKFIDYQYTKLINIDENDSVIDKFVKMTYYYLNNYEKSAYLAQMNGIFKNVSYQSMKEIYQDAKKTPVVANILALRKNIDFVKNNINIQEKWVESYNKIFNKNYSREKIINDLVKDFNKFYSKFINHLYLYLEKFVTVTHLPANRHVIKDLKETLNITNEKDLYS